LPWSNPSWFETVSHKLLRLLGPWALLGLLASTAAGALSGAGRRARAGRRGVAIERALLAGQLLLYAAAAVGPRAGRPFGVARTFVLMHAAAVAGLWRFVSGTQPVTWSLPRAAQKANAAPVLSSATAANSGRPASARSSSAQASRPPPKW
jgi:hypothetical protein